MRSWQNNYKNNKWNDARNVDKEAKDKCTLDIDNQKLKPTANLRILGVNIDDKLSFTEHISDICKKWVKK